MVRSVASHFHRLSPAKVRGFRRMGKHLCLHLLGIRDANYLQAHSSFFIFHSSFFILPHAPMERMKSSHSRAPPFRPNTFL